MDTHERRQKLVFNLAYGSAVAALAIVLLLIAAQLYVRWYVNQDFLFLGGFELEVLTASAFLLLASLLRSQRSSR